MSNDTEQRIRELESISMHHSEIIKRMDDTLNRLTNSLEHLAASVDDFKSLFRQAVPLRVVVILLSIMGALFAGTEAIKALISSAA